jgi:hypothetical protein
MLVMNPFVEHNKEETFAQDEPDYPVEVLESEWNPVLAEIHASLAMQKQDADSEIETEER